MSGSESKQMNWPEAVHDMSIGVLGFAFVAMFALLMFRGCENDQQRRHELKMAGKTNDN